MYLVGGTFSLRIKRISLYSSSPCKNKMMKHALEIRYLMQMYLVIRNSKILFTLPLSPLCLYYRLHLCPVSIVHCKQGSIIILQLLLQRTPLQKCHINLLSDFYIIVSDKKLRCDAAHEVIHRHSRQGVPGAAGER